MVESAAEERVADKVESEEQVIRVEDPDFRPTMKLLISPTPMQRSKTRVLLISLAAFIGASLVSGSGANMIEIATLVGVIFFHELGHMIAMRIVGYRDVRIFFIPFLGGAASGTKRGVARWKEGVVLLCGPLPGIVLGGVLAYFGEGELMRVIALQLIIVNALNLLPIAPLDGGQLFQVLLFSRQRHLELMFVGVTAAVVVVASFMLKMWVLAIVGFFILIMLPHRKRVLDLGHSLRDRGLPSDPAALDDSQQHELYRVALASLPAEWQKRWAGKPQPKAQLIEQILERATLRPPSVGATAGLLGVWLASLVAAAISVVLAIAPSWRLYTNDAGGFTVEMPAPAAASEIGEYHAVTTRVRDREYTVMWNDVLDPSWLSVVYDGLAASRKLTDLATSPNDRMFTYREGNQFVVMRLVVTPKGRVYMVGATAPDDDPDLHRFVTSFLAH
jgi:Zn-dependent protease